MPENFSPIFILGVLLSLGSLAGLLAERIKFPKVVAYILVGAIFSPGILGNTLHFSAESWSPLLTDVALGIIAYIIGSEIDLKTFKKEEKTVMAAVLGQTIGVILFVGAGIWYFTGLFHFMPQIELVPALVLGAIATATAPAASLAIIEEFHAKGKITNTLLGIIAVDDAVGVIVFTLFLGFATSGGFASSITDGLIEVGGSIVLGSALGVVLGFFGDRLKKEELRLVTIIGFIFLTFGLSQIFNFSMLLSCMSLGFVSAMFYSKDQAEWLLPLQHMEDLVFVFFFTLAGIHFRLDVFLSSILLVLLYIVLRATGKYVGAYSGLRILGAKKQTRRLLGLCLFPQAGVAIGLVLKATNHAGFEEMGTIMLNIILGSTIIFAIVAPFVTKMSLEKAGEIKSKN